MSLRITNTGTYNNLFDDLVTTLGTTLGWTLFDNVSADEKVYTIPTTSQGFGPAFLRLERDNTLFTVTLTVWKTWTAGGGPGGGTFPVPVTPSSSQNRFDFTSAVVTTAYQIYAGAATDGYIAVKTDGTGLSPVLHLAWIGILQSVSTFALHPVPTGLIYSTAGSPQCQYLDHTNTVRTNADAGRFFQLSSWAAATNPISGKSPIVAAFAWNVTPDQISGFGKDLFYCSAALVLDDIIQIGSTQYRVVSGGGTCILI